MSGTVFILGAGASAKAGAPLMGDFLDTARMFLARGVLSEHDSRAFALVARGMSELQLAHSKARLDLRNVEAVFAAFEMAVLFGQLGALAPDEITTLPAAMRRVIVRTIELSMRFPAGTEWGVRAPEPYDFFGDILAKAQRSGTADVSVLTFNYDIGLDHGLACARIPIDSGFGDRVEPPAIPLLKLHGSLNWAYCPKCREIDVLPTEQQAKDRFMTETGPKFPNQREFEFNIASPMYYCPQCSSERAPFLVPPTWSKSEHYRELRLVWRAAAQRLRDADRIYIIGYSWPASDEFFHQLFALGTAGPTLLRRVVLISRDKSAADRLRGCLFGEQTAQRFEHWVGEFESSMNFIATELGVPQ